jgi:TolB-like protein/Tfp pilus assembly protein PilF
LWTDRGVEQARHSLRQTLLVLRRALRDAGGDVIANNPSTLAFVPGMVETDVGRFRLLARSSDRAGLAEAAEVYAGPLLDRFPPVGGDFDDWLIVARSEVADVAIDSLRRLTDACLGAGDLHPAVLAAERMLALDLLREDSHRLMMEVYLRAGRRADAIRQYDACVEVLRRELDVGPSEETEGVVRRLRGASVESQLTPISTARRLLTPTYVHDGPPRVAVLPFRAIGPDPVPGYFAAGLVEDIVTLLATLREPVVVSSNSSRQFSEMPLDIRQVGNELRVRYVVSGTARHAEPWVRISVQLAEAESGSVLWGQSYDTKALMLFEAQDNIARRVVNTIVPNIHEVEMRRIKSKHPASMTAYDLVLQARDVMFRMDRESYGAAGELLAKAAALDPGYATTHALIADWYALRVGQGWSPDPNSDAVASDDAARAAIDRDALNVQALALHAHTRAFLHRDYDGAIRIFDRATDVAPNDASSWMWSAGTYAYVGQAAEAVKRAERAIQLSPRDRFSFRYHTALCLSHYTNGSYEEAIDWGLQAIREAPGYTASLRFTIAAMSALGRSSEARDLGMRLMRIQPDFRVSTVRERHPFRDAARRNQIAEELVIAGLPE